MTCEDFRPFIGAYVDGEFDERESGEFEAHLDECEECRRRVEQRAKLKRALKASADEVEAPDGLRERIVDELRQADREQRESTGAGERRSPLAYAAAGVPLVAGVVLMVWLVPAMTVQPVESEELPVVEQTVDWHQRELPLEVEAKQPAAVRDWFRGKVDFPVRLPAFSGERIELVGGRIANV
ncbi:MAG: anti-sigma factor, partial [Bradymonadaceae bacterium]